MYAFVKIGISSFNMGNYPMDRGHRPSVYGAENGLNTNTWKFIEVIYNNFLVAISLNFNRQNGTNNDRADTELTTGGDEFLIFLRD